MIIEREKKRTIVLQYLTTEIIVLFLLYITASTPVTALIVQMTSSSSLQISWGPPEMLNGILAYYELTVTSEADGSQQTWRIQHNQPTEANITGLGKTNKYYMYPTYLVDPPFNQMCMWHVYIHAVSLQ